MTKFDIEIYDTREDKVGVVRNVPAETELEACEKVAKKKGYRWIGKASEGLAGGYAINVEIYKAWHDKIADDALLEAELQRDIDDVKAGVLDEFRGLFWLYEEDATSEEDFDEDD